MYDASPCGGDERRILAVVRFDSTRREGRGRVFCSAKECERAYITKKYLAPDGKDLEVEFNSETDYSSIEDVSSTVESSNTYCTGITVRIHNAQVIVRLEHLT